LKGIRKGFKNVWKMILNILSKDTKRILKFLKGIRKIFKNDEEFIRKEL